MASMKIWNVSPLLHVFVPLEMEARQNIQAHAGAINKSKKPRTPKSADILSTRRAHHPRYMPHSSLLEIHGNPGRSPCPPLIIPCTKPHPTPPRSVVSAIRTPHVILHRCIEKQEPICYVNMSTPNAPTPILPTKNERKQTREGEKTRKSQQGHKSVTSSKAKTFRSRPS